MNIKAWFWNVEENRLRAGWRVLVQVVVTVVVVFGLYYTGIFDSSNLLLARIEISFMLIVLAIIGLSGRFLDRRRFSDFGLRIRQKAWWQDYAAGIVIGLLLAGGYILILYLLGWVTVSPYPRITTTSIPLIPSLGIDILTFASVGVMEELIRAYQMRNLAEGLVNSKLNWRLALLVGAVGASIFSMGMHLNQQGWEFWGYVFLNSMIYCLFYLWTGRIGIAMGLHAAWDFFLSTIISLGGTTALMNAVAFYSAPLTVSGTNIALWMSVIGLLVKTCGLLLLIVYIRKRVGKVRLQRDLTVYTGQPERLKAQQNPVYQES